MLSISLNCFAVNIMIYSALYSGAISMQTLEIMKRGDEKLVQQHVNDLYFQYTADFCSNQVKLKLLPQFLIILNNNYAQSPFTSSPSYIYIFNYFINDLRELYINYPQNDDCFQLINFLKIHEDAASLYSQYRDKKNSNLDKLNLLPAFLTLLNNGYTKSSFTTSEPYGFIFNYFIEDLQELHFHYPENNNCIELINMLSDYWKTFFGEKKLTSQTVIYHISYQLVYFPLVEHEILHCLQNSEDIDKHPLVEIYHQLWLLTDKLNYSPNLLSDIISFWRENEQYISPYQISSEDIFEFNQTYNCSFESNHLFYLKQIDNYRSMIGEHLFMHFINHLEFHLQLSENFPVYFQFSNWIDINKLRLMTTYLENNHIIFLSTLKGNDGFDYYRNLIFLNEDSKYENSERKQILSFLNKLLRSNNNWNLFFDKPKDNPIKDILLEHYNSIYGEFRNVPMSHSNYIKDFFESQIEYDGNECEEHNNHYHKSIAHSLIIFWNMHYLELILTEKIDEKLKHIIKI